MRHICVTIASRQHVLPKEPGFKFFDELSLFENAIKPGGSVCIGSCLENGGAEFVSRSVFLFKIGLGLGYLVGTTYFC